MFFYVRFYKDQSLFELFKITNIRFSCKTSKTIGVKKIWSTASVIRVHKEVSLVESYVRLNERTQMENIKGMM